MEFSTSELTGAIGYSVTVLPIVIGVAVLTDLSLAVLLCWFGVFQVVWGLYYGVPISVEPMKALAALVLAGVLTTGEFILAGLLAGAVLLLAGVTRSIRRIERYVGDPVVRGIQFGVALVLFETGFRLGGADLRLAGAATAVALLVIAAGYWNLSALVVVGLGGIVAAATAGAPSPALPSTEAFVRPMVADLTAATVEATAAQLAMTLGNAALATSLLLGDYFDRDISADQLSTSMGVMNLAAVPFGALPMCHGSGGVAGKYAFGARTAGANVILGVGYVLLAVLAVGLVAAYPLSVLGIVLGLVALQLARTSLTGTTDLPLAIAIGVIGVVVNLGVAFVVGVVVFVLSKRFR